MPKLILASNRLPVSIRKNDDEFIVQQSPGGLATGLSSLIEEDDVIWVGWHGYQEALDPQTHAALIQRLEAMKLCPIDLDPNEVTAYYNEVSNGTFWPLYHYQIERMALELRGWETYRIVNMRFAERIAALYQAGDCIWVHDYHLQLLPGLLRDLLPDARIGFFLHIPFPSSEIFRILPWRQEILDCLLGADLIGFHIHSYARHFASSLLRVLGVEAYGDKILYKGRNIRIGAFPLGVNTQSIVDKSDVSDCDIALAIRGMREGGKIEHIMLAIDRLDYTKGLPQRLLAVERLLDEKPSLRGKIVYVQIAAPSRDEVPAYKKYRRKVDELIGRINGKYGMPDYQPIHYISRGFSQEEVLALYRYVDVMLVTPLRDGMNLVAKEFIAARSDDDGVLVLSEFAGAAAELGEAVLVNPYDIDGMASGFVQAIEMSLEERSSRMKALRSRIALFDAAGWAKRFVDRIGSSSAEGTRVQGFTRPSNLFEMLPTQKILLFLDYDGTLFPIVRIPSLARPDLPLLTLLRRLGENPRVEVHIVSSRSRESLDKWFTGMNIHLHSEHGAMSRGPQSGEWVEQVSVSQSAGWKPHVRSVLKDFAKNTPGSFIEEKEVSLAWHYRMADPEQGQRMASELRLHGRETFAPMGLEVIQDKYVLEVRQSGINKGIVVRRIREQQAEPVFSVAIGDDSTDEDMFVEAGENGLTIVVGDHATKAAYRVRDSSEVRIFLELLASPRWSN